jgi:GDPmannose 4,6-dehydratase
MPDRCRRAPSSVSRWSPRWARYVEAMWLTLQRGEPADYVISTETPSVRECAEIAFAHVGLEWEHHVVTAFLRPAEVGQFVSDASNAKTELGWEPKTSFRELVELMADADLGRVTAQAATSVRPCTPRRVCEDE